MSMLKLTLPDTLSAFVADQVEAGGYAGAEEYVRELIRRDRERQYLRGLLVTGPASGPGEVIDDAWFERLQGRLRAAGAA